MNWSKCDTRCCIIDDWETHAGICWSGCSTQRLLCDGENVSLLGGVDGGRGIEADGFRLFWKRIPIVGAVFIGPRFLDGGSAKE